MQDCADTLMALWVNLPSVMESVIEYRLKDDMLQIDLKQPALKGIAKAENGDQVPFMCAKVHVIRRDILDDGDDDVGPSTGVLNAFRMNGKWQASITSGDRPSFKADKLSDKLIPKIQTLFRKGKFNLPNMFIQTTHHIPT